jgi:hypothetical protein
LNDVNLKIKGIEYFANYYLEMKTILRRGTNTSSAFQRDNINLLIPSGPIEFSLPHSQIAAIVT